MAEQPFHADFIGGDIGIDFAVGSFEPGIGHQGRAAMTGTGDVKHAEVAGPDQPVEVDVNEIEAGGGPPVTEQPGLDVLFGQWLLEQRVRVKIDLPDGQIVRCPPIGVRKGKLGLRQRFGNGFLFQN